MGRPKKKQVELRSYDLTDEPHLVIHRGPEWRISRVESLMLHFHNCFEVGVCLTECATVRFGEERVPVRAGDLVCVARNVAHTIWSSGERESEWCFIHLDPEFLLGQQAVSLMPDPQCFMKMMSDCHMILRTPEHAWAEPLLRQLVREAEQRQLGFQMCVRGLCLVFFTRLLRIYTRNDAQSREGFPMIAISPALDYLYMHYSERFSPEKLAQLSRMSPTNFRRRFLEETGTNPLSFLHQVRVLKSCYLLRTTREGMAEIAAAVGYASVSSFNRHFQEIVGCAPSAWRAMRSDRQDMILLSLNGWQRAETNEEIEARNAAMEKTGEPEQ